MRCHALNVEDSVTLEEMTDLFDREELPNHTLRRFPTHEAVALGRWLIDTFGEPESAQ